MQLFLTAISIGIIGSFHCIGMCGPIALALPVHNFSPIKKHLAILLYNFGRIFTYSIIGAIFGLLGQAFFLGGIQQMLSLSLGILILLSVFISHVNWIKYPKFQFVNQLISKLKNTLGKLFNKSGLFFLFLIGLLNGLLPCGLVYLGVAGSLSTGHYLKGAEFMAFFGLGTIPVMYSVAFFGQFISLKFRNYIRKATPYFVSIMAVLLILRGLNLGIPYVSPKFEDKTHQVSCCEKETNDDNSLNNSLENCH
jgi:sulfite exporter TauE/SafE